MKTRTYDQLWSGKWGELQECGPVHRRQREAIVALVKKLAPVTLLDVGCGAGHNLAAIAQEMPGVALSGTDVSQEALALAARRLPGVRFRRLDAQQERLDEQFDLILCNQVIEHLMDDISALRNMALMAKKWVLIATMRGRMRKSELSIGHFRNYSDPELRAKASAAGLEVVDIFGWGFPFYSPIFRTMIEWVPVATPESGFGATHKMISSILYSLYGMNVPRKGDVVTMLARPNRPA